MQKKLKRENVIRLILEALMVVSDTLTYAAKQQSILRNLIYLNEKRVNN